ncbi:hypothetical protein Hanom_Chr11g00979451 [Helianthus anomalus]
MELTSRTKMARFQTFWIQMRKNKPLDDCRKTGQISGTKMTSYSFLNYLGRQTKKLWSVRPTQMVWFVVFQKSS